MQWIEILLRTNQHRYLPQNALQVALQSKVPGPSEAGKYDNSNKISARKSYRANYQPHNKIILKTWIAGRNNIPSSSSSSLPTRGMMAWPRLESTYYATKGNFIQRWKGGGGGGSWLSCRLGTMVDIQARILFCLQNVWIIITLECSRESFAATE